MSGGVNSLSGQAPGYTYTKETPGGMWAAIVAFSIWGFLPLYWKQLEGALPLEIICHRLFWAFVFLLPFAWFTGRMAEVRQALSPKSLGMLFCSGLLLSANWLIFIWAVLNDQILETSLGNFINPIYNMFFGVLLFRDRPGPLQWIALGLAAAGVCFRIVSSGQLPWVAVTMPAAFCLYGVLRKVVSVEAVPGLLVETALLVPFALGAIVYMEVRGISSFTMARPLLSALLVGGGLVTCIPMVFFAYAARHLKMTTLGLLHYLLPSMSLLIGVFIYDEAFTTSYAVTFGCVWLGLALYTVDAWKRFRH